MSEESSSTSVDSPANAAVMARLLDLENRTGYRMQQFNGQRRYWDPNWSGIHPPRGCEVFVGKIPRDLFEDELVPVFEKIGKLYELRLMMDFSGFNRGYAFVTFTNKDDAAKAIQVLDNYEIRPGMRIGVCRSVDNCRLFVGGIPKDKGQEEIRQAMCEVTDDVCDVIVYPGTSPGEKNRGFSFVEYNSHRAAAMARRKLIPGRITLFGCEVAVDWAEPESEQQANTDLSGLVKNVYVRNLKLSTSEFAVWSAFNSIRPGCIETVKKIENRDFAFVHFYNREDALYAVQMMNGQIIDGQEVQVSIAKPNAINSGLRHAGNNINLNNNSSITAKNSIVPTFVQNIKTGPSIMNRSSFAQQYIPPVTNITKPNNNNMFTNTTNGFQNTRSTTGFNQPLKRLMQTGVSPPFNGFPTTPVPPNFPPPSNSSWKSALDQNVDKRLTPAVTLSHLANIKCPVTLLSEFHSRMNIGPPPYYMLYVDPHGVGATRKYIYRVNYDGTTYTPPSASDSIEEARKVAAEYVLHEIAPTLKATLDTYLSNAQPSHVIPDRFVNNVAPSSQMMPVPRYSYGPSGDMPPASQRRIGLETFDQQSPPVTSSDDLLSAPFNQYMKFLNDKKPTSFTQTSNTNHLTTTSSSNNVDQLININQQPNVSTYGSLADNDVALHRLVAAAASGIPN